MTREEHEKIVFGVRELPRREALKPSAMFLTPWLLGRAARGGVATPAAPRRRHAGAGA